MSYAYGLSAITCWQGAGGILRSGRMRRNGARSAQIGPNTMPLDFLEPKDVEIPLCKTRLRKWAVAAAQRRGGSRPFLLDLGKK